MKLLDAAIWRVTLAVGTKWCVLLFAALPLISLPAALSTLDPVIIVQWVAATFLQLVLLPLLMVGQNMQTKLAEEHAAQAEAERTKNAAVLELLIRETHEIVKDEAAGLHDKIQEKL